MATDLLPLLNNPELTALRHLTIVSDLGDAVIDAIAESAILPRLATLDLSHGTLSAAGAARLRDRWSRFAYLRRCKIYYVLAVRRSEGDEASQRELLDFATRVQQQILADDAPILRTVRFRPGALTQSDRALAQFFEHLRRFPRAHPSAEFIR